VTIETGERAFRLCGERSGVMVLPTSVGYGVALDGAIALHAALVTSTQTEGSAGSGPGECDPDPLSFGF
jgi:hypothetical protein